jgi:hypothetical protein
MVERDFVDCDPYPSAHTLNNDEKFSTDLTEICEVPNNTSMQDIFPHWLCEYLSWEFDYLTLFHQLIRQSRGSREQGDIRMIQPE